MAKHPNMAVVQELSPEEVAEIWTAYSDEACANWLNDDNAATVYKVFSKAKQNPISVLS